MVFTPKPSGPFVQYSSPDGVRTTITPAAETIDVVVGRNHLAVVTTAAGVATLCFGARGDAFVRAAVVLGGARDCGRAFVVDPVDGESVAEWRLR